MSAFLLRLLFCVFYDWELVEMFYSVITEKFEPILFLYKSFPNPETFLKFCFELVSV